jgi:hypothetical protein
MPVILDVKQENARLCTVFIGKVQAWLLSCYALNKLLLEDNPDKQLETTVGATVLLIVATWFYSVSEVYGKGKEPNGNNLDVISGPAILTAGGAAAFASSDV